MGLAAYPLPIVWWLALLTAGSWNERDKSCGPAGQAFEAMNSPFFHSLDRILRPVPAVFYLAYGIAALVVVSSRKNTRRGAEHGSAKWGDVFQIAKKYRDKSTPKENLILTQHFQMGMDGHKHKRNTNVLVIGGSGAGKEPFLCHSQRPQLRQLFAGDL